MKPKTIVRILLIILLLTTSSTIFATKLTPFADPIESTWRQSRFFFFPISSFLWQFEGHMLEARQNERINLYQGDSIVTSDILKCQNDSGEHIYSRVRVVLDTAILLPKGRTYKITIPSGYIWARDEPDLSVTPIKFQFTIPEHITLSNFRMKAYGEFQPGDSVPYGSGMDFSPSCEISSLDTIWFDMYRENVKVRSIRAFFFDDMDVYSGYMNFNTTFKFEKGVRYNFKLKPGILHYYKPEGCQDITNEEYNINIIGNYVEPAPKPGQEGPKPLTYYYHRYVHGGEYYGDIYFYYNDEIEITEGAKVELWRCDRDNNYKVRRLELWEETEPDLQRDEMAYVLHCRFAERKLECGSHEFFQVHIPEGTVVRRNGQPDVNPDEDGPETPSGIADVVADDPVMAVDGRNVTITGLGAGMDVALYGSDGRLCNRAVSDGMALTLEAPAPGVYILKAGRRAVKMVVR